jgi:hypothetical protein
MDIAAAVCFLASPLTDFMTGMTFRIDMYPDAQYPPESHASTWFLRSAATRSCLRLQSRGSERVPPHRRFHAGSIKKSAAEYSQGRWEGIPPSFVGKRAAALRKLIV